MASVLFVGTRNSLQDNKSLVGSGELSGCVASSRYQLTSIHLYQGPPLVAILITKHTSRPLQEYLVRLHTKREGADEAARERQARRRRLATAQQAAAESGEERCKLEATLSSLTRQSAEEARIAARLQQVKREEGLLQRNRETRLRQYRERREKDWAEALARETQLVHALKVRRHRRVLSVSCARRCCPVAAGM